MAKSKRAKGAWVGNVPSFATVKLKAGATASQMETALDDQHHLQFVVKWIKSKPLVLMSLQVTVSGGLATELLEHPLGGNSGDLTADMGVFAAGNITIEFIIGALTDIKQAATFIVEDTTHVTEFKPAVGEPLKSLKQGETWSDSAKFIVGNTA